MILSALAFYGAALAHLALHRRLLRSGPWFMAVPAFACLGLFAIVGARTPETIVVERATYGALVVLVVHAGIGACVGGLALLLHAGRFVGARLSARAERR